MIEEVAERGPAAPWESSALLVEIARLPANFPRTADPSLGPGAPWPSRSCAAGALARELSP